MFIGTGKHCVKLQRDRKRDLILYKGGYHPRQRQYTKHRRRCYTFRFEIYCEYAYFSQIVLVPGEDTTGKGGVSFFPGIGRVVQTGDEEPRQFGWNAH